MSNIILDIVKNPIFIGLAGAIITYSYFYWVNRDNSDNKKKKKSNNTYHILISLCVGLIFGFGTYIYIESMKDSKYSITSGKNIDVSSDSTISTPSPKANSIHIPSKSLIIPQNLPDVFIEAFD